MLCRECFRKVPFSLPTHYDEKDTRTLVDEKRFDHGEEKLRYVTLRVDGALGQYQEQLLIFTLVCWSAVSQ